MNEHRADLHEGLRPPAIAADAGLGGLPLGSAQSRALARSLMTAHEDTARNRRLPVGITVQFVSTAGPHPEDLCKCRKPKPAEFGLLLLFLFTDRFHRCGYRCRSRLRYHSHH